MVNGILTTTQRTLQHTSTFIHSHTHSYTGGTNSNSINIKLLDQTIIRLMCFLMCFPFSVCDHPGSHIHRERHKSLFALWVTNFHVRLSRHRLSCHVKCKNVTMKEHPVPGATKSTFSLVLPQFNMQINDIDFSLAGRCWYSNLLSEWWTTWQDIE